MKQHRLIGFALCTTIATTTMAECDHQIVAVNDYPTEARADYVFGCMAANGQTQEMLRKCSCSIDIIASLVPYATYEQIETVLRVQQVPGQRSAGFRESPWVVALVDQLKRAQAESTLRCF